MDSGDLPASFPACAFSGPRRYYTPVYTQRGRGMEEEYFFNQSTLLFRAGKRTPLPGGTAFFWAGTGSARLPKAVRRYHTQYRLNGHEQVFSCHVLLEPSAFIFPETVLPGNLPHTSCMLSDPSGLTWRDRHPGSGEARHSLWWLPSSVRCVPGG